MPDRPHPDPGAASGGGPKIARTVAEACVGDLLWCEPDRDRRYLGGLHVVVVKAVARVYLTVDRPDCPGIGKDYRRATGAEKLPPGRSATAYVMGVAERERQFWRDHARKMARAIEACSDLDALRTVAFALGMDGPPDFSIVPAVEDRVRSREGGVDRVP